MGMIKLKATSTFLAVALASISTFCFAECAFAVPQPQETRAHHCQKEQPTEQESTHNAGEPCCPAFVALIGSQVEPLFSLSEATANNIAPPQVFVEPTISSSKELYIPSDLSPPRVFLVTNAIHAPPALI